MLVELLPDCEHRVERGERLLRNERDLATEQRATMILDTACQVVHDPDREMRLLWTRVVANA